MNERDASCADRIEAHKASRPESFAALSKLAQVYGDEITPELKALAESEDLEDSLDSSEDLAEAAQERIYEMPLSVETMRVHKILLSTGGPADWLEAFVDSDGDLTRIVYHFQDWFDHAETTLEGAEYAAAEAFVNALIPEL